MAVGIHRQCDGLMPHHLLHHLGVCARHRHPCAAGMPQRMKVDQFAFVVRVGQEVALLLLGVFLRIVLRFG